MSEDSLEELLARWRKGDQNAATDIYFRYEKRLLRYAKGEIGDRLALQVDAEDIVLSVMDTVLRRIAKGQYQTDANGSIWSLLCEIARNKVRGAAEFHGAGKRAARAEASLPPDDVLPYLPACRPSPQDAAVLADELERIRTRLKPLDFQIFEMKLAGYSNPEIGRKLGRAAETVRYHAKRIAKLLRLWATDDTA